MRISNPKTTAGGLPLATTWYVNKRFEGTKFYIDMVSGELSSCIDARVNYEMSGRMNADDNLSGVIEANSAALSAGSNARDGELISAFCRYITGKGTDIGNFITNYLPDLRPFGDANIYTATPRQFGYAYLGSNGKVSPELIPDISIMDVNVVDVKDIYDWLVQQLYLTDESTFHGLTSFYSRIITANGDVQSVVGVIKDAIEAYVIGQQDSATAAPSATQQPNANNPDSVAIFKPYSKGDIVVITFYGFDAIKNDLLTRASGTFKDVFSKTFMAGAWICSEETREGQDADGDHGNNEEAHVGKNKTINFVKISYNQGEITSVNNTLPTNDGDVFINLANIWRTTSGNKIGSDLAHDIECVRSVAHDANAAATVAQLRTESQTSSLIILPDISGRFVFDDDQHNNCHAYVTIDEFQSLNRAGGYQVLFIKQCLGSEIDRAKYIEGIISGNLTTEISRAISAENLLTDKVNYVSGVVGTEASLSGVTVTSALLSLKKYNETTNTNVVSAATIINGRTSTTNVPDYDVLKVYTVEFGGLSVAAISGGLANMGIGVTANSYKLAHSDWEGDDASIYEGNIYNYFGFPKNANGTSFVYPDISEITFSAFPGIILDIFVKETRTVNNVTQTVLKKIDADIECISGMSQDNVPTYTSNFTILGEYDMQDPDHMSPASNTVLDNLVVRYTNKLLYKPLTPNKLFK